MCVTSSTESRTSEASATTNSATPSPHNPGRTHPRTADRAGIGEPYPPEETFELPLNRPRLQPRPCCLPGLLPAAVFVAGIWSTESNPSSLGFAKAGPRSRTGTGN